MNKKNNKDNKKKTLTRRGFLKGAGVVGAVAVVGASSKLAFDAVKHTGNMDARVEKELQRGDKILKERGFKEMSKAEVGEFLKVFKEGTGS
ncbi:MAG: twin-arginine translocation signal domain-containing protein [Deltaproteobacteria bacterium]|nr:twin-arginine translocation signal domain-containing protein [Deltaproteobacteria bacterium]